ncbi:loc100127341 protein, related [Neospora caninum Liverpool]|uniref:Acyltransferase n=1 Tax=Neospora caninum (strain Liverpool) TaxID=572307 RepID=F0V931_NEOCL|nr:loc100127341 protein, related [Neospora caninum Liverpool]CBZ50256.1 loc100127341 protein, related [Neospora caninum Liverpool]|eukprot:XP_003880290.1 loc100127341 protein, related [Neospora caninum Liverpool]
MWSPEALLPTGEFGSLLGYITMAVASIVKHVPIYGHIIRLIGSQDASGAKLVTALTRDRQNIVLSPGGIAEMYTVNEKTTGADVVPVYCFGNSETFKLVKASAVLQPLARFLRVALLLFYGRFGLPIPFEVPLLYVIGRALRLPKVEDPTNEWDRQKMAMEISSISVARTSAGSAAVLNLFPHRNRRINHSSVESLGNCNYKQLALVFQLLTCHAIGGSPRLPKVYYGLSRAKLREALTNSGDSVVLVPGGIAEMYAINPSKECLHLNERKGLLKLALETGAEIVPIYCFGNTQTFKLAKGCRTLQPFARLFRIALLLFYGRFGLPVSFEVPLLYVIGKALRFPQIQQPSSQDIEAAQKQYLAAVQRIFNTYKGLYGWQYKSLEIV